MGPIKNPKYLLVAAIVVALALLLSMVHSGQHRTERTLQKWTVVDTDFWRPGITVATKAGRPPSEVDIFTLKAPGREPIIMLIGQDNPDWPLWDAARKGHELWLEKIEFGITDQIGFAYGIYDPERNRDLERLRITGPPSNPAEKSAK